MRTTARRRYGLVGTGHRAQLYLDAVLGPHRDVVELVAWSDTNPGRLDFYRRRLEAAGHPVPTAYAADRVAPW